MAAGTTLRAFWIIALNSWMYATAGRDMIVSQAATTIWLQLIFNPSFFYRLTQMLLAFGLSVAFQLVGISVWQPVPRCCGPATQRCNVLNRLTA